VTINKVFIMGVITSDISHVNLPSGLSVLEFSVKTTESYEKDGFEKEVYDYHNIKMYGKTAEKYMNSGIGKGDIVLVEGKIKNKLWEKQGVKMITTYIAASTLEIMREGF
jgi:single-strand DNA-binding protein